MSQITVRLNERELQALVNLAEMERRHPREQAAYIIRTALVQCGVLSKDMHELGCTPESLCMSAGK